MNNFEEQILAHTAKRMNLQEAIAWCNAKNDSAYKEIGSRNLKLAVLHQLNEVNDKLISDYTYLNVGPNEERSGSVKFGLEKVKELEVTLAQVSQQ